MVFTAALKRSQWAVVLVLLGFVKHSTQQETVTMEDLKTIMLTRFDSVNKRLVKADEQVKKLWDIKNVHNSSKENNKSIRSTEILDKIEILENQLKQSVTVFQDKLANSTATSTDIIAKLDSMNNQLNESITSINKPIDGINNQLDALDKTLNNSIMMMNHTDGKERVLVTFNPTATSLFEGQEFVLECGVYADFQSCHWDHNGDIYQLTDMPYGNNSNIRSATKGISNQCGIIISNADTSHTGDWSCNVITDGQNLTMSKEISIEKNPIIFDKSNITSHLQQEVELMCGVDGAFTACQWEHSGNIYQVADVIKGRYSHIKSTSNTTRNQCGVVISSLNTIDSGVWACKVLTNGRYVTHIKTINITTARNCLDLKNEGKSSGTYKIIPCDDTPSKVVEVYCDMVTDGGGWTVIQRRDDFPEQQDFYKTWSEYANGFGNVSKEFWLGNDNIHCLTEQSHNEIRIDLQDWSGSTSYAMYGHFYLHDSATKYKLGVKDYSGTAGDSLAYHNNRYFSTYDSDSTGSCASSCKGAWWYRGCEYSNLNGLYGTSSNGKVSWYHWKNSRYSLKKTEMKIRQKI